MTDNTVKVETGVEVYQHNIQLYADEYIWQELKDSSEDIADCFIDMIYYIADRIDKPDNSDIELLDNIFNIYVRLCSKYKVLPTLEVFAILVGINRSTFTDWSNGEYRRATSHGNTVKKWKDTCRAFLVHKLSNSRGADANLIFIAKAAYDMRETAPVIPDRQDNKLGTPDMPRIMRKYGVTDDSDGQQAELPIPDF